MDGDLFQGVLLGLLALGLIVLVALLATLGGIRKALEERASQGAAGGFASTGHLASEPEPLHQPALTAEPEPTPATAQPVSQAAPADTGQAATIRGVLEQHGLQGGQEAAGAAASSTATPEPAQEEPHQGVVDSAFAAHADDPQEEPFQRDGRWWFRRGDELLLYDEATGQWQPAPGDAPGAGAPAPAAAATQTQTATTTQATPVVADQVATYWKCATCGAVNGSTAATCRMCFAARP